MTPLHSKLLKAGIVEFAQSRLGKKLFHDVKPYKGKYGHQVSKDFAKYRKYLGINGTGQTFHGIRHMRCRDFLDLIKKAITREENTITFRSSC